MGQEAFRWDSGVNYDFRRPRGKFVGLEGEARVAIRMEHQGKQDTEVFSWNKEQGMTIGMEF